MKAWLTLQQGQGIGPSGVTDIANARAGYPSYPLDPFKQPVLSIGRASHCDIVVHDHRVSRHHSDIRWNGRQWEVVDRGSTNGTFVNGIQIYAPQVLRFGDRLTIGDTTMVLREFGTGAGVPAGPQELKTAKDLAGAAQGYAQGVPGHAGRPVAPLVLPQQPQPQPAAPAMRKGAVPAVDRGKGPSVGASALAGAVFWLAQVLVAVAVVCLAAGAFLPWFRVTGSLSRNMAPLVQGITDIISSFIGEDLLSVTQDIQGIGGFGKVSLGIAVASAILLLVDVFLTRRSVVPGVVYLLTSLMAAGVVVAELKNLYDLYDQVQSMTLLFGIKLADVVKAFGNFIELEVTLLPGLYLTAAGLGFLLVGGITRLMAAILGRSKPEAYSG